MIFSILVQNNHIFETKKKHNIVPNNTRNGFSVTNFKNIVHHTIQKLEKSDLFSYTKPSIFEPFKSSNGLFMHA